MARTGEDDVDDAAAFVADPGAMSERETCGPSPLTCKIFL